MTELSAIGISTAVAAGTVTATEIMLGVIGRIEARNGELNAFSHLNPEWSLREAGDVDKRRKNGEILPLAGVPVVIKDNIWVAGCKITQGSQLFQHHVPTVDADAVSRLRRAGAVIAGIGTCSEFACKGVTNTPLYGKTRHPLDPALTPGGSSGGSAVAIAAGITPLALGTDAGGSGRRPAAHTGIVGFKPSQDAIGYGPGFPDPVQSISVIAPMARTVSDIALMFDVLAQEPASANAPSPDEISTIEIALAPTLGLPIAIDDAAMEAFQRGADALSAAGYNVTSAAPDWPEDLHAGSIMPLQWAGLARLFGQEWRRAPERFDPDIGVQIEAGLRLTEDELQRARQASATMRTIMRAYTARYRLVLSATTPCAAWPVDDLGPAEIGGRPAAPRDHAALTPQFNHAGLPALSLPCGSQGRLPLGLQIGAGFGEDRLVLAAASAFENIFRLEGLAPAGERTGEKL